MNITDQTYTVIGLGELAFELWAKNNLIFVPSKKRLIGFVLNENTLLWEEKTKDFIRNKIVDILEEHLRIFHSENEYSKPALKAIQKLNNSFISRICKIVFPKCSVPT